MPDIYTHILSGRESIKTLDSLTSRAITEFENIFYLGCMGPDMFLYHNFYPWKKNKAVKELGDRMHSVHCGDFIVDGLRFIKENMENKIILDERAVYLLGFICHYATDRTAHPYIFYKSGHYDANNYETYKFKNSHKIMELAIDYHMSKKLDNQDINNIKVYNYINIGDNIHYKVAELYEFLLYTYFKEDVSYLEDGFINEAYCCIKKAWQIFYDPTFIKRHILKVFGYDSFFYPINPYERDYMNESQTTWSHPCDLSISSNKTFYQIFDDCVKLSYELISMSVKYLKNEISYESLIKFIGNYSYATNMDAQNKEDCMKYFNPIF